MLGLSLYRGFTEFAAPIIYFYLRKRLVQGKEHPERFAERQGRTSRSRPEGPLIWLHAASVGEAQSALSLVDRILAWDEQLSVLVTTGTVTSAEILDGRLPARSFHQFIPIDRLPWVRRFLNHWQPDLAIWVESEFWPNLITETLERSIPAILVNGRISARSFANWRLAPGIIRALLRGFDICFAQTEAEAERLRILGARDVRYCGNLKFSAQALPVNEDELINMRKALNKRPVWLAASTHPGEESMAAVVHVNLCKKLPNLLTIIVPRHPRRGPDLMNELSTYGLTVSHRGVGDTIGPRDDIYIADTLGELGLYYRLVDVVFIGGSMGGHGGHNPLEAAQLDCAIIHGPDMTNFSDVAEQLAAVSGVLLTPDVVALTNAVQFLLTDDAERKYKAKAAMKIALENCKVVDSIFDGLSSHIISICEHR